MAKDGTKRGGARPGAGRKKKVKPPDPENVIKTINTSDTDTKSFPQSSFLLPGSSAEKVYFSIYKYARDNGADKKLPRELVELFAVSYCRWCEAEEKITKEGFTSKHPTTGVPCRSPYISVSESYSKQCQNYWYSIWTIVREGEPKTDAEDDMEGLLD